MKAPKTISKAEFARRMHLSKSRISQLVSEGLPVTDAGGVDYLKAKRWVDRHIDKHRSAARKGAATPAALTTTETRSQKLQWEAQLRELEFRKRSGELVDRAKTERTIFERAAAERDRWIGWVSRAAVQIASEAEADPTKLHGVLDRLVRNHLTELAATPLSVLRT